VFNSDFSQYASQMSRVVEEGYNEAHLSSVTFSDPDLNNRFHLECDQLDPDLQAEARLRKIRTQLGKPRLCERVLGTHYSLFDDRGRTLFKEEAFESLSDLSFLVEKSGRVFSNGEEFLGAFQAPDEMEGGLSGIALVKGNLRINRELKIRKDGGGIVLVEGDIILEKVIKSPGSDPLTLISLNGNIQVKVQELLEVGLVALQGRVSLGSVFHLRGILAAKELSIQGATTPILPGARTLEYNPRFDPTSSANLDRSLKIMSQKRWRFVVR
jgi:hypothetical protein